MHLHSFRLRNYRRLRDVRVELGSDISILVGANNSGKTSATQAIQMFLGGAKDKFSLYDFSSNCWSLFDAAGERAPDASDPLQLPAITLDLWFEVTDNDLHRVIEVLPSLTWQSSCVGIRVEFSAKQPEDLIANFRAAKAKANEQIAQLGDEAGAYTPWPKSLSDYLHRELHREFDLKYYVLDQAKFDSSFCQLPNYDPLPLTPEHGSGGSILRSLLRVDCLSAQRHLTDPSAGTHSSTGRSEDLSKRLSRFYRRNLDQRGDDHSALKALFDSESQLNKHLASVFRSTLGRLEKLGYPGLSNPRLVIKSALNPASIMNQDARVYYALGEGDEAITLPDSYNGLGFKNLIYMVIELLDLQAQWIAEEEKRPPLHLIFIEEPEAHLHAQLQQVFIRNVLDLLKIEGEQDGTYLSQVAITTHSPHILYERGFRPIRYFRRVADSNGQASEVLNLSAFYSATTAPDRDFLERYLKLTHCDLFFADAAILVEGNVERLLLPVMIEKEAKRLRSACLSVLEVGGAFGHRFQKLIEFLGITTLIITDIDSVERTSGDSDDEESDELDGLEDHALLEEGGQTGARRATYRTCPVKAGALTSNQTLIQWLPKVRTINDLHAASPSDKIQEPTDQTPAKVRVAYQTNNDVEWQGDKKQACGRTLEEAFALENAMWCQSPERRHLGLKLKSSPASASDLALGLHKRVISKSFDKTRFALGVLMENPSDWVVPQYIKDGLHWLSDEVALETEIEELGVATETKASDQDGIVAEAAE